jgi:hypothetical protein
MLDFIPLESYFHHQEFAKFHLVFYQLNPNNQYYQQNRFFSMQVFPSHILPIQQKQNNEHN